MSASVVSGVNSPPVLELSKHIFDFVALFIERRVMWDGDLSVRPRWNAGGDFAGGQGVSKPVGIIAFVGQQ